MIMCLNWDDFEIEKELLITEKELLVMLGQKVYTKTPRQTRICEHSTHERFFWSTADT